MNKLFQMRMNNIQYNIQNYNQAKIQELETEISRLTKKLISNNKEIAEIRNEDGELSELKENIAKLTQLNKTQKVEIHELNEQTLSIKARSVELEKQLTQIQSAKTASDETLTALQQTHDEIKDKVTNKENIIEELKHSMEEMNNKHKEELLRIHKERNDTHLRLDEVLPDANDRCYTRDEVLQYSSIPKKEIQIRSEIKQRQTSIDSRFDFHSNRLIKWSEFHQKIQNEFENYKVNRSAKAQNKQKERNEDEKEEHLHHDDQDVNKLLKSYTNCVDLLQKQQARAEDIGEFVIALSKSKKELKSTLNEYNTNQAPNEQKYQQLCTQYTNLKLRREQLQKKVTKLMKEINLITDEENTINKQKCDTLDALNVSIAEKEEYDALLTKCKSLTAKYNQFEIHTDEKTDEIGQYFEEKWDEHERKWTKWDVNDIICWVKYLGHENKVTFSKHVDLDKISKEMQSMETTGKSLEGLQKTDLKLFGFIALNDITQIYKRIRELVSKYPDIDGNDTYDDALKEGVVQDTAYRMKVPKQYICSISGKIMRDPVIYDGVTYDRSNLLQYVQENGTIPGSDEQYDENEGIFKNRKLKQKIEAFLSVNPQFVEEGL